MSLFKGLSAFPVTPAGADGRVLVDDLGKLLSRLGAAKVDSVGLLGSTGSYMYLDRAERRRAISVAVECLGETTPVIVAIGALRTDHAVRFARDAEEAGADGLLLAPVSYMPLTEDEVFQHFATVAGATGLPLCIYDNPSTTHFSFSDTLLTRLSAVPSIVAIKRPSRPSNEMGAYHRVLRSNMPAHFAIGYSGDWSAADAILADGEAWYSVVGGLLPQPTLKLMRAAQAGDQAETRRIDRLFEPLWSLLKELTSYRVIYAAGHELGLIQADPPRPILPLSRAHRERIRATLGAHEEL